MNNIEQILFNGFTIYISNEDGKTLGMGLKYLGKIGMDIVELDEEEIKNFSSKFPTLNKQLETGKTLQMYMAFNHTYVSNLGEIGYEDPYAETVVFNVVGESSAFVLQDTLNSLEEKSIEIFQTKNTKVLKKMYRLYGSDKYETYNMNS